MHSHTDEKTLVVSLQPERTLLVSAARSVVSFRIVSLHGALSVQFLTGKLPAVMQRIIPLAMTLAMMTWAITSSCSSPLSRRQIPSAAPNVQPGAWMNMSPARTHPYVMRHSLPLQHTPLGLPRLASALSVFVCCTVWTLPAYLAMYKTCSDSQSQQNFCTKSSLILGSLLRAWLMSATGLNPCMHRTRHVRLGRRITSFAAEDPELLFKRHSIVPTRDGLLLSFFFSFTKNIVFLRQA